MLLTRRAPFVLLCLLALTAAGGRTQQSQNPFPQSRGTNPTSLDPRDPRDPREDANLQSLEQRQARMRNEERQKRLVSDTDKLLSLATQLHEEVGKTDKNILSIEVIHRADEIEKLAHSVKERMKG